VTQTTYDFIEDLRRLTVRWHADIAKLAAAGEQRLADQVRSWIAEAEGIIAAHGTVGA
jgi:hypothetical protein